MAKRWSGAYIDGEVDYRPGDPEPQGYIAWHAWAEVQYKAGLRQRQCSRCGLYKFPQELDPARLAVDVAVCRDCAGARGR